MRRPPSYSDSFLFISPRHTLNYEEELLELGVPLAEPTVPLAEPTVPLAEPTVPLAEPTVPGAEPESWSQWTLCFIFKGSFHILCISVFETSFYFLYVNRSEDAGIFSTINTYYQPLVEGCSTRWANGTKWLVDELFMYAVNKTRVDAEAITAYNARAAYNNTLILQSSLYSVVCLAVCIGIAIIYVVQKWKVNWGPMFLEHILFIGLLAAYEFFFYTTIIYKYTTLSTAELNKYIVDGLASCAMASQ